MVEERIEDASGAEGSRPYRRSDDVVTRRIAGECLLVPIRGEVADLQRIFVLNPVGERIWESLAEDRRFDAICDIVQEGFEIDRLTLERDVAEFLAELEKAGLAARLRAGEGG